MRNWIRRAAIGAVLLVVAAVVAFVVAAQLGQRKLQRTIDVAAVPIPYQDGAEVVERGRYLFASRGCADCHGPDGGGRVVVDDGGGLHVRAPNIAQGAATVASYGPLDWVRVIRHGVKPGGRPVMIMPSEDWNRLTDADVAALVAYVRRLPPAAGGAAEIRLPMPLQALYAVGMIRDAAEKIDHTLPPARPVAGGRDRRARCVRGERLHRLPRRAADGRQDPGHAARLAAGRAAASRRGQRHGALPDAGVVRDDAEDGQAPRRQRGQPGHALRHPGRLERGRRACALPAPARAARGLLEAVSVAVRGRRAGFGDR